MAQKEARFYRRILEEKGATDIEFRRLRKHYALRFSVNGRRYSFTFDSTPSDWRAQRNNLARIKRVFRARPGESYV